MVYQTDLMEEEGQLPMAGTHSKLPALHSHICCLAAASALQSAGLFANSANRETASSYPSHCRDCRTLCQLLPCWASLPDPGLQTFGANPRPYMLACTTASHAWPGTSSIFCPRPMANFGLCLFPETRETSNWRSLQMPLSLLHLIKQLVAFTQSAQVV